MKDHNMLEDTIIVLCMIQGWVLFPEYRNLPYMVCARVPYTLQEARDCFRLVDLAPSRSVEWFWSWTRSSNWASCMIWYQRAPRWFLPKRVMAYQIQPSSLIVRSTYLMIIESLKAPDYCLMASHAVLNYHEQFFWVAVYWITHI